MKSSQSLVLGPHGLDIRARLGQQVLRHTVIDHFILFVPFGGYGNFTIWISVNIQCCLPSRRVEGFCRAYSCFAKLCNLRAFGNYRPVTIPQTNPGPLNPDFDTPDGSEKPATVPRSATESASRRTRLSTTTGGGLALRVLLYSVRT